jgi:hypothetical protein
MASRGAAAAPPGSLTLPDRDSEELAVRISLRNDSGQTREVLQMLKIFRFEVAAATKTKKSEFNIKLLPVQAVNALRR